MRIELKIFLIRSHNQWIHIKEKFILYKFLLDKRSGSRCQTNIRNILRWYEREGGDEEQSNTYRKRETTVY